MGWIVGAVFVVVGAFIALVSASKGEWFGVLFGLVFAAVGAATSVQQLKRKRTVDLTKHHQGTRQALAMLSAAAGKAAYRATSSNHVPAAELYRPVLSTSPLPDLAVERGTWLHCRLLPRQQDGVLFRVIFAVAWHAFLIPFFVMVVNMIRERPTSLGGYGFGAFLSIFLFAGAAVWVPIVRRTLANRRLPTVEISEEPVYLGDTLRVCVNHPPRSRLNKLEVSLVCTEIVSYNEGTTVRTQRRDLMEIPVLQASDVRDEIKNEAEARLPLLAPHSFASKNNQLEWAVRVHADIPHWPDYDERFVFRALPRAFS